jgi:hypothetical protein
VAGGADGEAAIFLKGEPLSLGAEFRVGAQACRVF